MTPTSSSGSADPLPKSEGRVSRRCIFCGGGGLTKEHVLPRWVTRHWTGSDPEGSPLDPEQEMPHVLSTAVLRNGEMVPQVLAQHPSRPGVHVSHITVRAVCSACNNGWMSKLESRVQPLITALMDGSRVRLTKDDAAALIRWCQKTAVMFDVFCPEEPVIGADVHAALARGDTPPGSWDIRLGWVDESAQDTYSHSPYYVEPVPYPEGFDEDWELRRVRAKTIGVQTLIVAGPVVFMVRYSPHQFRGLASIDADYFTVEWPPAVLLSSNGSRPPKVLKPGGWPTYLQDDLNSWSLWVVTRDGSPVNIAEDDDGRSWVEDLSMFAEREGWKLVDSGRIPIDVAEHFASVRQPTNPRNL